MNRRNALKITGISFFALAAASRLAGAEDAKFEITKTPEEWQKLLTPEQYATLREEATERKFTSALLEEKRKGNYTCAGCDSPLFASETKYDSKTGWPSFFDHLPNAIGTKEDSGLFGSRTEVHCRRCGGHLGHVFDDGPQPTGLRYCMNGIAMKFVEA